MQKNYTKYTIDDLKRVYNQNLNILDGLSDTAFDERTKAGIRACINKSNAIVRGLMNWKINHQRY